MNKLNFINNYILKPLRLDSLSSFATSLMEVYPYNLVLPLFDEACRVFSNEFTWLWSSTDTDLVYNSDAVYDLKHHDIHRNKIAKVYYISGTQVYEISRCGYLYFKEVYMGWTTATGIPQVYTIKNNTLRFYPKHDQDYSIKIKHYKDVPLPVTESHEITLVPEKSQFPIPLFAKWIIALLMQKSNAKLIEQEHLESLAEASTDNQQYCDVTDYIPSNFVWQ